MDYTVNPKVPEGGKEMAETTDDINTAEKAGAYESAAELKRLREIHGPEGLDEDGHLKRTGTTLTASAHIITAVIGAGVLSLAYAVASIGWIGGPIMLIMFAVITLYCSWFLADCYRFPGPTEGRRLYSYPDAVRTFLGPNYVIFTVVVQQLNLIVTGIGYTVTSGLAMAAMYRAVCYHEHPENKDSSVKALAGKDNCYPYLNQYMIIFGAFQLVFSQLPNMGEIWWMSIVAAIMSFGYALIGLGLSIGKATEPQMGPGSHSHGTLGGIAGEAGESMPSQVWGFFLALGNAAFAYSFSFILIEIEDTLKGPGEARKLKTATSISVAITTFFYMSIGCIGYAAFGNDNVPGNLLTGFGFFEPYWLVVIANLFIVIHLFGGYQVWSQPFFYAFEGWMDTLFPKAAILRATVRIPIPGLGVWHASPFRIVWRSIYVVFTTIMACLIPFFNDIVGIMGSLGFWPLTVFLPVSMHIAQRKIPRWSPRWIALQTLNVFW
ncbi:hypothetical protein WJX84_000890 [Apatococcus fuscideae]|uniref:Amino acid transporter transmembrane domain-containing protein n=1 Tax=Apatococcus fuscideae TaxID=2026836 RepID=A0AAW1T647_9CHLO